MTLSKEQLMGLARLGAAARLAQLDAEITAIKAMYPEFAGPRRGQARAATPAAAPAAPATAKPARKTRKPYNMSPAARKAVSERMRKFWAERRKAKAKAAGK